MRERDFNDEAPAVSTDTRVYLANPRNLGQHSGSSLDHTAELNPRPQTRLGKILVPVALAGVSDPSLEMVRDLAAESRVKIVLLHVVQLNIAGEERGIARGRLLTELCQEAEGQLKRVAAAIDGQVEICVDISERSPADTIVETAVRLKVDAIVLNRRSRAHRPWSGWLRRNTAAKVVRDAPCAVWLLSPGQPRTPVHVTIIHHRSPVMEFDRLARHEPSNPFGALRGLLF